MIVAKIKMAKPFRNSFEPGTFRLLVIEPTKLNQ